MELSYFVVALFSVEHIVMKEIRKRDSIVLCLTVSGREEIYCCGKYDNEFRYYKGKPFSFGVALFHIMLGI